jgi:hypothetical protein
VVFLFLAAAPLAAASDTPLFPTPLHLVRRVEDPIASATVEVDEYCTGNKIITVNGSRTAIVDYDRQELLEIDRAAATYSVARFDEIAKSRAGVAPAIPPVSAAAIGGATQAWKTTPLGVRESRAGRSADAFEIVGSAPENVKVEVAVDRQVTLSRRALDAITGSGYPNRTSDQQEAAARACARTTANARIETTSVAESYGLPLEQSITIEADGNTRLTVRNSIVRVTNDLPPPEVLAIPAGAKLVESRAAQLQKTLKELEETTPAQRP